MGLDQDQRDLIENVLKDSLRKKFKDYSPETTNMPFHTRLLGKDRMALYSFIHSLSTNFGTSVFEPVAKELSKKNFVKVKTHISVGNTISRASEAEIQNIMDKLITGSTLPNKKLEIEKLRSASTKGDAVKVKPTKIDLYLEDIDGRIFLFDLKTAKPNFGSFKEFKRTLLEWVAVLLFEYPEVEISSLIAIPYNPYEPKPYNRWTMRGMIDINAELMVADEFWDFLGGRDTYGDLLDCFERVGIEMRSEIDEYFERFR
ncbi:TdeIII family type II restriction endonuclease [Cuniculiplasma sp. SKW3]|uniref:TdeIII family type II restriction endonuclease n=1 Tax=Cuniculiplasma sp. SKW3 TaxID=3400170 RepID=UPI003FD1417D